MLIVFGGFVIVCCTTKGRLFLYSDIFLLSNRISLLSASFLKSFEIKVSDFFNVFIYISERIKKSITTCCSVVPICHHIFFCKGTTFKGTPNNEATETSGSYELYSY